MATKVTTYTYSYKMKEDGKTLTFSSPKPDAAMGVIVRGDDSYSHIAQVFVSSAECEAFCEGINFGNHRWVTTIVELD